MFHFLYLRYAVLVAAGLAVMFATYAVSSAPTRIASRLGIRGLMRRRALEGNPLWSRLEPLVRWLGVRVSGVLGDTVSASIDTQLDLAGGYLGLTSDEYVALCIVSAIGGGLFGAIAGAMIGSIGMCVIIGISLGGVLPYLHVSGVGQTRLKEINEGLPYTIDLMALAMSAGLDFPGAVRQVVEKSSNPEDALVIELTRLLRELQIGRTRKQALSDFAARCPTTPVNEFVSAIIQAEERGNPVADVLQIQAGVARMRRSVRAEEAAAKAAVKMLGPLFLLFACIMLLVMGPMVLSLSVD